MTIGYERYHRVTAADIYKLAPDFPISVLFLLKLCPKNYREGFDFLVKRCNGDICLILDPYILLLV